jgi:hypothetical protein
MEIGEPIKPSRNLDPRYNQALACQSEIVPDISPSGAHLLGKSPTNRRETACLWLVPLAVLLPPRRIGRRIGVASSNSPLNTGAVTTSAYRIAEARALTIIVAIDAPLGSASRRFQGHNGRRGNRRRFRAVVNDPFLKWRLHRSGRVRLRDQLTRSPRWRSSVRSVRTIATPLTGSPE